MSDLRKAAEKILEMWDSPHTMKELFEAKEALRQALAQPEQEPVAWMDKDGDVLSASIVDGKGLRNIPLYPAPPNREWQNLTDDEIKEIVGPWGETPIKGYTRKLFDQIEAKLKEKNT